MAPLRAAAVGLAVLAVAVLAADPDFSRDPDWPEFQHFVAKYNRMYSSSDEVASRFAIFKSNLRLIEARNAASKKAVHGVNNFADLTREEFLAKHTGYRKGNATLQAKAFPFWRRREASSIDWRELGAVTPVKDQGQCGSCWAFSATEQIESDYFLRFKTLLKLSPQQIVSCDDVDQGCNGGDTVTAYQYVQGAGGLDPSSVYPYASGTSGNTGRCHVDKSNFDADVAKALYVSQGARQERQMLQQIAESPMSVCVDAEIWQTYESGIITADDGCGTSLDHCVQVVGYNADQNYWLVRNSWGTSWGNDGYIWVEQGGNICGVAEEATIVTASQPQRLQAELQV